ncbi:MAG: AIM24 family protein [Solirubrobacterales bacterium]
MAIEATLAEFKETAGTEPFQMQGSKMVKVQLQGETIQAKLGSMVAYQGDVKFEHAGSGGLKRMAKKAVTGEGASLMKVSGTGEVFLADLAQEIQLVKLSGEAITVNGANLLAFDADIDWDIKKVEGVSGFMGGGMFNTHLSGDGYVAILSDGPPVLLELDGEQTFADPQAAITWSEGVSTSVKTDVNLKTVIGRGSGESVQLAFSGKGWLLIQPSEGRVTSGAAGGSGGAASSAGGALGKLLSG